MQADVFWYAQKDHRQRAALAGAVQADVVVVGGGMMGLSCAQTLFEAGIRPVLVERDFCGAGASGKTSGFVTPDSEIELSSLIATYGTEKARRVWEFVLSGVDAIRANIVRYAIDCDYQIQDSCFVANSSAGVRAVQKEHEARQSLGYPSKRYSAQDLSLAINSPWYAGGGALPGHVWHKFLSLLPSIAQYTRTKRRADVRGDTRNPHPR